MAVFLIQELDSGKMTRLFVRIDEVISGRIYSICIERSFH